MRIKKQEPFTERELKAEKTGQKKFTTPKRFFQNLTTHYNYFFNANNKLNEVLDRAKQGHRESYDSLLPFYNWSVGGTAADSLELDSVVAKSRTAIVLHDLRGDWIDDMYALWGKAYYLKGEMDSAYTMFQFINWAYAPKESGGYYRYIGSRMDGATNTSIATVEKDGFIKRMISDPPSRNEAFLWQVRTLLQRGASPEAGSLLALLRQDPEFPERLKEEREEITALYFYHMKVWDSAAMHLAAALPTAQNRAERSRWEYLIGQMWALSQKPAKAGEWFAKAAAHTNDPVLEVWARLQMLRNAAGRATDESYSQTIQALVKMARKPKYEEYRETIWGMAARMEAERGNFAMAQQYLTMAALAAKAVGGSRHPFLDLADLRFSARDYRNAAPLYDSATGNGFTPQEMERIAARKKMLMGVTGPLALIDRQDSLLRIAAMPEGERTRYVRDAVRNIRRQQGLRDEVTTPSPGAAGGGTAPTNDLFTPVAARGEWYFNNPGLRTTGASSFRQIWGNRPNVDNWRRMEDVTKGLRDGGGLGSVAATNGVTNTVSPDFDPFSFDALSAQLPITEASRAAAHDSIRTALLKLADLYTNTLEDPLSTIAVLEDYRRRYPDWDLSPRALSQMQYSYARTGNAAKAAEAKSVLIQKYPSDAMTLRLTGQGPDTLAATRAYEGVYDLFLGGKFSEAETARRRADSTYRTSRWSPQLLYIEAVYYIRERKDSLAKERLSVMVQQERGSPMGTKAEDLLNVLNRRAAIEAELTTLQITRPVDSSTAPQVYVPTPSRPITTTRRDTVTASRPAAIIPRQPATTTLPKATVVSRPTPAAGNAFAFYADSSHYAVVYFSKVDPVYVSEARNAFNRYNRSSTGTPPESKNATVSDSVKLLLVGPFSNATGAAQWIEKVKPIAGSQIIPWLKGGSYRYSILSEANLRRVVEAKDFEAYRRFLSGATPLKF